MIARCARIDKLELRIMATQQAQRPPLLLGAHMSIAGGVSHALERAAAVGSNAVQVFTKNNRQWVGPPIDGADVARWQEQMPALGIHYAVSHASYLINLASSKDDLWEKSMLAHADELLRAHAYAIPHVVLHPGAHTGAGVEYGVRRISEALNRIHHLTPECDDTITCLEVMAGQGSCLGRSLAELRAILDTVEEPQRVGVCLDTCHLHAAGYDLRTAAEYAAFMQDVRDNLGLAAVKVWHFNDSKGALGSNLDRHAHIGEGEIGLEGFRWLLNDPAWDGVAMLLETPKDDTLAEDAANLLRLCSLVEDAERIPVGLRSLQAATPAEPLSAEPAM
jgi:deoxyribonuclease-4